MILKKPYAFIIKHFRMIHLLLLIPMIYLIMETKGIVAFFQNYVLSDYTVNGSYVLSNLASNYINIFMYLAVIIILITNILLSFLLQTKNKPTKYYNVSILYYIGLFILITGSFSIFKMIESDTLNNTAARLIRDFSYIIYYSQFVFVVISFVRGVGFNIKKFNFKSDLANLEINSEDSEEFEFLLGIDTYKTKRTIRRFFRELKYYYKENKFIFTIIFIVILIGIGTFAFMNREVYQREYKENEIITFGYLSFNIKNTYLTSLTYNGKKLNEDKVYLVMQIDINNRYREDKTFNYMDLELIINKEHVTPNLTLGSYFSDFGNPYNGSLIKGNTNQSYIIVYELDKYLINSKFYISAYSGYDSSVGGIGIISKKINLSPTILNNKVMQNYVPLGSGVQFANSNLGNTIVSLTNYSFMDRLEYQYDRCVSEMCYQYTDAITVDYNSDGIRKTLLVLDYQLELDQNSVYMNIEKSYKTFFEDFLSIEYTINGKEYTYQCKLANKNNYQDQLVMRVPREMESAEHIRANLTVRNISYSITLK